ncbi:MAG: efflux RND transporter periplasmic adaptor subunit [Myxococcales bacterium]|nr:efflux RND transporter periplasmic adaptor subunit [Myxococcales bacterium]
MITLLCVWSGCGAPEVDAVVPTLTHTVWTDSHELFVEISAPVVGQRFRYHAHVTRLADNQAVTEGSLTVRLEQDGFVAESHTDESVAQPGIFAGEAAAPGQAGDYAVVWTYASADQRVELDGGVVSVGGEAPVTRADSPQGEILLPKEVQWQIPFSVGTVQRTGLARSVEVAAIVEPTPAATTVVAAPVDGLLAWTDGLPVVGREVTRGERLAALVPAGAAGHWSRLQVDLATARVDLDLANQQLARVEQLQAQELLPERRLQEARATAERAAAEVSAARRRVSALTSGGSGAMVIAAPVDGVVVSVGAGHGHSVHAGNPLLAVSAPGGWLLRGRVHDRGWPSLDGEAALTVQRGDWAEPRVVRGALLTEQLVFDPHTLSAPVTVRLEHDVGLSVGDLVQVWIAVQGETVRLAVPRTAVVEINGQDVVFVQRTGESFTRRRVTTGAVGTTHVEVIDGLQEGERVVVRGGFDVHVASVSRSLQSHRH